jgi:hypothetical protein
MSIGSSTTDCSDVDITVSVPSVPSVLLAFRFLYFLTAQTPAGIMTKMIVSVALLLKDLVNCDRSMDSPKFGRKCECWFEYEIRCLRRFTPPFPS